MKISTVSNIGNDGIGYITIEIIEPKIGANDLWEGGKFISFNCDWKKQTTKMYDFTYKGGVPSGFEKCLKTWKDEVLAPAECLKYCEENF